MADYWNIDWLTRSDLFAPLRGAGSLLPHIGWPDTDVLNAIADDCSHRIVNANGERIRFVVQEGRPARFEDAFEPGTFLRGEVLVRRFNWHDLYNALVWMTFPTAKAALNARQYTALQAREGRQRTPEGDALTLFDEDGVIVLSSDAELLRLVQEFRWKELFWQHRDAVRAHMRFTLFGHALFEKALNPFVGMTGKAILLEVPASVLALDRPALYREVDRRTGLYVWNPEHLRHGRALAPLPVLGVPGWWPENENEAFYDDTGYFRPGRRRDAAR
ncbi:MAG: DUF3025 domain-containing protein [Burkholderiales bacterium]